MKQYVLDVNEVAPNPRRRRKRRKSRRKRSSKTRLRTRRNARKRRKPRRGVSTTVSRSGKTIYVRARNRRRNPARRRKKSRMWIKKSRTGRTASIVMRNARRRNPKRKRRRNPIGLGGFQAADFAAYAASLALLELGYRKAFSDGYRQGLKGALVKLLVGYGAAFGCKMLKVKKSRCDAIKRGAETHAAIGIAAELADQITGRFPALFTPLLNGLGYDGRYNYAHPMGEATYYPSLGEATYNPYQAPQLAGFEPGAGAPSHLGMSSAPTHLSPRRL